MVLFVCVSVIMNQSSIASTKRTSKHLGPFVLLNNHGKPVLIYATVRHIKPDATDDKSYSESDYGYEVSDARGSILLKYQFEHHGSDETRYGFSNLTVPGVGPTLLFMEISLPAAPGSAMSAQLFGFNAANKLVPFTQYISPWSDDFDTTAFQPVVAHRDGRVTSTITSSDSCFVSCVEAGYWNTFYGVFLRYPVIRDSAKCRFNILDFVTRHRIEIDSVRAYSNRRRNLQHPDTVTIYVNPRAPDHKSVLVSATSTVQFLDAELVTGKYNNVTIWLHVRIDTSDGYVLDQSDLQKLGLDASS
jgi:hypothetical protein